MELLLIQVRGLRCCVEMEKVSRVLSLNREPVAAEQFLQAPQDAPLGLLLQNGRVLPVDKLERTASCADRYVPINPFIRGCSTRQVLVGFYIVEKRIYGVLGNDFLATGMDRNHKE